VPTVQKGAGPSPYQSVARSVATDVVRPPLAGRRIARDDGGRVPYHYRAHRSERVAQETVDGSTFLGRMVQPPLPKGFTRIRYDGVQATKAFAQVKVRRREALAKVEGVVRGAVQRIARLTSRPRYAPRTGRAPLICPHGRSAMGGGRLWQPPYGRLYDAGEGSKRGPSTATTPRAGP
jgi:hypothetical protein